MFLGVSMHLFIVLIANKHASMAYKYDHSEKWEEWKVSALPSSCFAYFSQPPPVQESGLKEIIHFPLSIKLQLFHTYM